MRRSIVRLISSCTLSLIVSFALVRSTCISAEIYVAPGGNDQNPGTKQSPVATLSRARDLGRQTKRAEEPLSIILRGGTYYLPQTLVLEAEDSGTMAGPVVFQAAPGETAVISGGRRLDLKWTDSRTAGVKTALVPEVREGKLDFDQLFLNGRRQHLARYPNYNPAARIYGGTAADAISPERIKKWSHPEGGFVHALHAAEWGDFHYRIMGVDAKGNARLEGGWQNNRQMGMHREHRFVENIFEELDAPGEWFLDHQSGALYFMPPQGVDLAKARIEVAGLKRLIEFRGSREKPVRFVTFRGLTITHAGRTFMEPYEPLLRSDWCIYRGGAVFLQGTEDCGLTDCFLDAVGGNAVFVSNYNRRVKIAACKITEAGASAICFVGDPKAVRFSADEYGKHLALDRIDTKPGPKGDNYPADCRVEDCLLHTFGVVEKQTAGVEISMSDSITVSHASIYDCPRAGINIGDGCWGGHVIEYCDIFDTVKETGDHGSFNSWGRDRYWNLGQAAWAKYPDMALWDCRKTIVLHDNRWRCDHGWDIDLDDGSSNFHLYNNLCLNGGLKFREGFQRTAENNIMVNNSFHPHVWYAGSGDVFRHNIVMTGYQPIGMPSVWGKLVDKNLLPDAGSLERSQAAHCDLHSAAGDPHFIDPAGADFRVQDESPALKLGFKNFPMDQFGVTSPKLRAEARSPQIPAVKGKPAGRAEEKAVLWLGAKVKSVTNLGELSAAGLPSQTGVILVDVPAGSAAAKAGLKQVEVIVGCNGKPVKTLSDLKRLTAAARGKPLKLEVYRGQRPQIVEVPAEGR
jgi:hypothetical protein